jgi:di-heme cytochrome c peroxidase
VAQFRAVFGSSATPANIAKALAAFERTLVSHNSPFDRYLAGDKSALSEEAKRGWELFQGATLDAYAATTVPISAITNSIGSALPLLTKGEVGLYETSEFFMLSALRGCVTWPKLHPICTMARWRRSNKWSTSTTGALHSNRLMACHWILRRCSDRAIRRFQR